MFLDELFKNTPHIEINQLSIDSRLPMKDCIFFCVAGIKDDGHDFVKEAIKNGANVIVYSEDIDKSGEAIYIKVSNTIDCLNSIAARFYDYPDKKMETYITCGCDGVSTVSYCLTKLIKNFKSVASIGVNGIFYNDSHLMCHVPTLNIIDTQKYLREFVKSDIKACCLEADPLALAYKKLDSITPNVFIYTSTNEYSTYFNEMDVNYYDVLCSYLYTLDDNTAIVLNRDDSSFEELIKATGENTYSYGFNEESDYVVSDLELKNNYSKFVITHNNEMISFKTKLVGYQNVRSIIAAISALNVMGYDLNELAFVLPFMPCLKGHMEIIGEGAPYYVYVDEANDINTVKEVYQYANSILEKGKKIVTVLGINSGDEKGTIKELGTLSAFGTKRVVLTENNSYNSNVDTLLNKAMPFFEKNKPILVDDRKIAIESAIDLLNTNDILLILGKGKEEFIVRSLGREAYDGDSKIASDYLKYLATLQNDD